MVMGYLYSTPLREHSSYFGGRKRLPLRPPTVLTREDGILAALRRAVSKPLVRSVSKNAWILAAKWRLVNERVSARRDIAKDQSLIWRLGRTIKAILWDDRRWRAKEAGAEVEALMGSDPPLHRGYWHRINGWYKAAVDCALPPARVTLERITAERVTYGRRLPNPGTNIPISVELLPLDNSVPTDDEIEWAVKLLRNHRSGGLSGMRAEHLKRWLAEARKAAKDETTVGEETTEGKESTESAESTAPTEAANLERVVDLVQTVFREGRLA